MDRAKQGAGMPEILLAEDNPADVYLIREALREHSVRCRLRVVSDGQEVLRIFAGEAGADKPVDLVILDLNLPRHDGIEILQRLRESPRFSHVPVVVLTSSDSPRDRQMATGLGATRFLRKPSSLEQFLAVGLIFRDLLTQAGSAESA
jgi:CheY-like chemotaxis protein